MKEQIAHDYSIVSQAVLQPSHDTEQKLEEFKSNLGIAFEKVSHKTSKNYHEALQRVKAFKGKTKPELEKFYQEILTRFEKTFEDTLAKIKKPKDQHHHC